MTTRVCCGVLWFLGLGLALTPVGAQTSQDPVGWLELSPAAALLNPLALHAHGDPAVLGGSDRRPALLFDGANQQCVVWPIGCLPKDYAGTPRLQIVYHMTSAVSGTVGMRVYAWPETRESQVCEQVVPPIAGHVGILSCAVPEVGYLVPLRRAAVYLCRTMWAQDAAGTMEVVSVAMQYRRHEALVWREDATCEDGRE